MDEFKIPNLPLTGKLEQLKPQIPEKSNVPTTEISVCKATTNDASATDCPYKEPSWSKPPAPDMNYKIEILKSGQIIDEIKNLQSQANWKFGRLPANDIEMAHPTISRFHAVLQYKPKTENIQDNLEENERIPEQPQGWYIYDLDSTHGTFLNKQRIPPKVYIRIRVGHMLQMGNSTRKYILSGPEEDEEPESELSVSELRAQRQQQEMALKEKLEREARETEERERNAGISWGMAEDANEETDLTHNPYASSNNEELFLDDPKRTLRGYFEREGLSLEYKCDELSTGTFVCRVELPIDDLNGRPLVAEVVHKGRKKECVVQCALEACRILDRHGVLRQANQEPLKRKLKPQGSDSEEDDFWDRTGDIEKKKQRKSNVATNVTLTYEDLLNKNEKLTQELDSVQTEINKYQELQRRSKARKEENDEDDLDNFMENLSENTTQIDKTEIRKLRLEEQRLKAEQEKTRRLIKLTKPTELPPISGAGFEKTPSENRPEVPKRQLPMIGKRNQYSKFKLIKVDNLNTKPSKSKNIRDLASDEEEVEEDEEEQEQSESHHPAIAMANAEEQSEESTSKTSIIANVMDDVRSAATSNIADQPELVQSQAQGKTDDKTVRMETVTNNNFTNDSLENEFSKNELNSALKKRRIRQRQRNARQDVDIEETEEHESIDKYAKWVPPPNQSGDGITELNEKFGY